MRPGCVRVETWGSYWWFDETAKEYLRLPKAESPREKPEWSDERAGVLQDAVWHPYESFEVDEDGWPRPGLFITQPDGRRSFAPM